MRISPLVTILMPVYNGAPFLRTAIESMLAQTFTNFEFLIIDDGSTDSSVAIVESYADSRIRLVKNERNLRLVATLNRGLELARGELVARMDCDDISLPNRLAAQVDFMDTHPEVAALGTAIRFMDSQGTLQTVWRPPQEHVSICWALLFGSALPHPTVMMRKDVIRRMGAYSSRGNVACEKYGGQDYELWQRLAQSDRVNQETDCNRESEFGTEDYQLWQKMAHSNRLANLPQVFLHYRVHSTNVTVSYRSENERNINQIARRAISELIGSEISTDLVKSIRTRHLVAGQDAYMAARLVYRLYGNLKEKFSRNKIPISASAQTEIAMDAAERIFYWAYYLYGFKDTRAAQVCGWAWQVAPQQTSMTLARLARRKAARYISQFSFRP